jgi:Skp family chaperone for outer membrane proteins
MKGEQIEKVANGTVSANGQETATQPEATIDQVRDLLFGGAQRSIETRLDGLREEVQASLNQLQAEFTKELAAMQAKVQELERETEQKQLASQRDIGAAISELGATISGLGSGRIGKG